MKFHPLIDELQAQLLQPRLEAAAAIVGEPAAKVRATLEAIMPVELAKLGRIATEIVEVPGLFDLLSRPTMVESLHDEALLDWLQAQWRSNSEGAAGVELEEVMLGRRAPEIARLLGDLMTIPDATAAVLLQFGLRLIAQSLSVHIRNEGLDGEALTVLLMQQKESLLPSLDVRLVSALGYADPDALLAGIASMAHGPAIALAHP